MVLAQEKRNRDQWNRIGSPEINPHTCCQLIYDKKAKIYNGEKTVSSISGAGKTEQIQSLERNPFIYDQLTTTKEARLYNGEKTVSSISGAGKTG